MDSSKKRVRVIEVFFASNLVKLSNGRRLGVIIAICLLAFSVLFSMVLFVVTTENEECEDYNIEMWLAVLDATVISSIAFDAEVFTQNITEFFSTSFQDNEDVSKRSLFMSMLIRFLGVILAPLIYLLLRGLHCSLIAISLMLFFTILPLYILSVHSLPAYKRNDQALA